MCRLFYAIFLLPLLPSCMLLKPRDIRNGLRIQQQVAQSPVFSGSLTGFTLLDPASGKTLADVNGGHYFIPASNVKILTLATCLEVLGDSVPALQYVSLENGIVFRGTGDPTLLHPKFEAWQKARHLLYRAATDLLFIHRRLEVPRYGPGWAWDDFNESYQTERSTLPVYGNCFQVSGKPDSALHVEPTYFARFYQPDPTPAKEIGVRRQEESNAWTVDSLSAASIEFIPFRPYQKLNYTYDDPNPTSLLAALLEDTLKRPVAELNAENYPELESAAYPWRTLYSTPIDTVLRRMMHQSDNFVAEQMLLVCSGFKFDRLRQDTMIKWMLDSALQTLPQRPRWVDGSGLSRYNLLSPQSIALVLQKLWKTQSQERLLSFFPAGGVQGTLSGWYAGKEGKPYVYAKTGSMSGVNCLSGYLRCKSGKVLIFSFMHNNFIGSSKPWKMEMQNILEEIYRRYP